MREKSRERRNEMREVKKERELDKDRPRNFFSPFQYALRDILVALS